MANNANTPATPTRLNDEKDFAIIDSSPAAPAFGH
jgi:hypothetical protein